jgi:hypothetical protein
LGSGATELSGHDAAGREVFKSETVMQANLGGTSVRVRTGGGVFLMDGKGHVLQNTISPRSRTALKLVSADKESAAKTRVAYDACSDATVTLDVAETLVAISCAEAETGVGMIVCLAEIKEAVDASDAQQAACASGCHSDSDCKSYETCSYGACVSVAAGPDCKQDIQCGPGFVCDVPSGICYEPSSSGGSGSGGGGEGNPSCYDLEEDSCESYGCYWDGYSCS